MALWQVPIMANPTICPPTSPRQAPLHAGATESRRGRCRFMPDEITECRTIYQGWFNVLMLRAAVSGESIEREIVEHPSGAAVLAYDPERRVALLVSQTRPPVLFAGEPRMLEVIAGALDDDGPAECVRREALEEGGVRLRGLQHVGELWATPASSTERVHYFLAEYEAADRVSEGGGLEEEEEHLGVCEVPLQRLWQMAEAGELRDAKTLTLVQALRIRRPDLFSPGL